MANETIEDIKSKIEFYVTIDDLIQQLTEQKSKISRTYYATNSLTGCMPLGETEELYHRPDTPEKKSEPIDRLKPLKKIY